MKAKNLQSQSQKMHRSLPRVRKSSKFLTVYEEYVANLRDDAFEFDDSEDLRIITRQYNSRASF